MKRVFTCEIEEDGGYVVKWCAIHSHVLRRAEAAEAQVAELKKDAERYRYLRNTCFTSPLRDAFERGGCNLDAAIDAAKESGVSP